MSVPFSVQFAKNKAASEVSLVLIIFASRERASDFVYDSVLDIFTVPKLKRLAETQSVACTLHNCVTKSH